MLSWTELVSVPSWFIASWVIFIGIITTINKLCMYFNVQVLLHCETKQKICSSLIISIILFILQIPLMPWLVFWEKALKVLKVVNMEIASQWNVSLNLLKYVWCLYILTADVSEHTDNNYLWEDTNMHKLIYRKTKKKKENLLGNCHF